MGKRSFVRPAPGNRYTAAERAEWGRQQDVARAARAAPGYQKPAPAKRASRAKTLVAQQASSCFDSLVYQNGTVTAVFAKKGAVYEYDMTLAEAREWFSDASLGEYFNAEIR